MRSPSELDGGKGTLGTPVKTSGSSKGRDANCVCVYEGLLETSKHFLGLFILILGLFVR